MANHSRRLIHWSECLRGRVPKDPDWISLLGLANQTLTTPALMRFATRFKDQIPEDVYFYIEQLFERNVIRNKRLVDQLTEVVGAINDRGVIPVLLKGAAILATAPQADHGLKLMSDLDIMVSPDETEPTLKALLALGYTIDYQPLPDSVGNWHVDLKRFCDVGMIDLHRAPPGPAFLPRVRRCEATLHPHAYRPRIGLHTVCNLSGSDPDGPRSVSRFRLLEWRHRSAAPFGIERTS